MKLNYYNSNLNRKRKKNFYPKTLILNMNQNKIKKKFIRYSLMDNA